ncbi:hypothetical protein SLA2020_025620 [Shorea laevis]
MPFFILPSVEKGKVTEVINSDSNEDSSEESSAGDVFSKGGNGSRQKGEGASLQGSIDMNRAALEEFESDVGNVAKKPVPDTGKVVADKSSGSSEKKITDIAEMERSD